METSDAQIDTVYKNKVSFFPTMVDRYGESLKYMELTDFSDFIEIPLKEDPSSLDYWRTPILKAMVEAFKQSNSDIVVIHYGH